MSDILVFLEQTDGSLPKASLTTAEAARQIKEAHGAGNLHALCLGKGSAKAAEAALSYGFATVYYSEDGAFDNYLAMAYAAAFEKALSESGASIGVAPATTTGKDFFPRVAAATAAGQASDIIAVNSDKSFRRPMFAGDVLADVEVTTDKKLITVRPTAFGEIAAAGGGGKTQELTGVSVPENAGEFVNLEESGGDRPELTAADVVISGGRALQSAENFEKYIYPLADVLNAAVGASRAAVDSGYAPNDWQVGQTGKVVAPELYIAIGISGAIQHLAGMKDSKVIVAINKDPDAPIFDLADYGLVADLYDVLPQLTEAIKSAKG